MWRGFSRSGLARDGRHWLCCASAGQGKRMFSRPGFVLRHFALRLRRRYLRSAGHGYGGRYGSRYGRAGPSDMFGRRWGRRCAPAPRLPPGKNIHAARAGGPRAGEFCATVAAVRTTGRKRAAPHQQTAMTQRPTGHGKTLEHRTRIQTTTHPAARFYRAHADAARRAGVLAAHGRRR